MPANAPRSRWAVFARAVGRELVRLDPDGGVQWPAIRVGISVAVPMAVIYGTGHGAWAAFAMFGALSAVFGKHLEYSARLWQQIGAGLALVVAVTGGTAVGVIAPGSMLAVAGMTVLSVAGLLLTRALGWLPIPSLFLVFAFGTVSSYAQATAALAIAPLVCAASVMFAVLMGQSGRLRRGESRPKRAGPVRVPLSRALTRSGTAIDVTCYAVGPLLAGTAANLIGIGHPYWAAVAATAPLAGPHLAAQFGRAGLRVAGTALGVAITFAVLHAGPPLWVLLVVVTVCQIGTELFIQRNYGIAVAGITPIALILSYLASRPPLGRLLADRLVETALGVAASLLVLIVARWMRGSRTH